MVDFVVFNELSLPFTNKNDIEEKFKDFFLIFNELKKKNVTKIRMDKNFKDYLILEDISLQQFFGQLNDSHLKDSLREFITNRIVKLDFPLIMKNEEESEQLLENEYFYNSQSTLGGLACCDIWNTIAISFFSNEQWNKETIILQKQTILDEEEVNEVDINIRHASKVEHLQSHEDFFKELEEEKKLEITQDNFWDRRKEFFPNKIIFCKEIKKQTKNLDTLIFQQAISILRDIESNRKKPTDYKNSPESESVCNSKKLKNMRIFTIQKIKIQFNYHIKSLPNANRIYFLAHKNKIYIGYIGEHLPTKKNK